MIATLSPRRRRTSVPSPRMDWAYFVDLDGTLLEIATRPEGVHVDAELRDTVSALSSCTGGAVAIITGRPVADVDRLFPDLRLAVAGQHGLERRTARGELQRHPVPGMALGHARETLGAVVRRHPALRLEDKGLSLALHYRQAPALASYAHRVMRQLQERLGPAYGVQRGKRVVELKPAGRDKGAAIRDFMSEIPFRGRRPVFIGDDATDEYGFDVVNQLGGVAVKVGRGRSAAPWRMPDVTSVRHWLSLAVLACRARGSLA